MSEAEKSIRQKNAMINRWLGMVLSFCATIILAKATLFLWKEWQEFNTNPPLDHTTFELHIKPQHPGTPDARKVDALKEDYGAMIQHYRPVLVASIVLGGLSSIATVAWFLVSLRRRPRNQTPQTSVEPHKAILRSRWACRLSPRQRIVLTWASLALVLIFSGAVLHTCGSKSKEIKAKGAAQMLPLELKFYMKEPDPSSSSAATVRKLQDDYLRMQLHWPLLGMLHVAFLFACWFGALGLLGGFWSWLWPRNAQPRPQLESSTSAA